MTANVTHLTPYITPEILTNAPTGIAWKTIPSAKADSAAQLAEQTNICVRASAMIDTACNNVVRATIDVEQLLGPDYRVTINNSTSVARLLMSRYPISQVLGAQVSNASTFPPQWVQVPASQLRVERPPLGLQGTTTPSASASGGQGILMAPGYISMQNGRNGFLIEVTYINGWPHAALTATSAQSSSVLQVNDCTGWGPPAGQTTGANGIIYDGSNQEAITCIGASALSGPGTLTLASPLSYEHGASTVVSALPGQIMQAAILFSVSEALVRGATATTIMTTAGVGQPTGAGDHFEMKSLAHELCLPYRRVI